MEKILSKIREKKFENLKGTDLNVKIPVLEDIINKMLSENVKNEKIGGIRFRFLENNHFIIALIVRVTSFSKPVVKFVFKLKEVYSLKEDSFNVVAEIVDDSCSIFMGKRLVINQVKSGLRDGLPPFLRFENDKIGVNVPQLLSANDLGDIINYLDTAHFNIELEEDVNGLNNNKLWAAFQVKI